MSIIPCEAVDPSLDIPVDTVLEVSRTVDVTVEPVAGRSASGNLEAGTRLRVRGCAHWMVCGTTIECADIECTVIGGPWAGRLVRFIVGAGPDTDLLESARKAGVRLADVRTFPLWLEDRW